MWYRAVVIATTNCNKEREAALGKRREESKLQTVAGAMLLVELGVWLIPLTLVFVPCRRIVLLLQRLQELHRSLTQPRITSADMLSRFSRLNSMAMML
ncbi:hypothetical protein GUJ93_ZPchr0012g20957 [Zizania palustris]|uniref:Uncharacterized protein n=1 Tax=Zizania palustris TaxID=103762 RepID=A0A8J5WPB2_ZIZPA|nr:hypothetical protein GUJ93_ZPchr0012g20957 [Zizania palustris]